VSPYREPTERAPEREDEGDRDLVPAGFVLWIASVALCAHRVAQHEAIRGHEVLAAMCVVALPYAVVRALRKHKKYATPSRCPCDEAPIADDAARGMTASGAASSHAKERNVAGHNLAERGLARSEDPQPK
jgi:hypothetical protein